MKRVAAVVALFVCLGVGRTAFADARTQARRAFSEGMRAIANQQYSEGIVSLKRANEILPHPNVQYNIAQAYLSLEDFDSALEWFRAYLRQPVAEEDAQRVQALVNRLEAQRAPTPPPPSQDTLPAGDTDVAASSADLRRLKALARDLEPLTKERANELAAIANRLEQGVVLDAPPAPDPTPPPPPPLVAASNDPVKPAGDLRQVEDYEERRVVTAATRQAASPQDAPAVVWVITQAQIRTRGYASVAEALRAVAGLHVIDDHVFVDVGVRGIHGGLRGMSRIIKVLIDGHPVTFRPTSGNFLGLEMIPIRAIDRIELLRGPGSALYGANAFLGVLQIVTRRGGDVRGGSVGLRGGLTLQTAGTNTQGSLDAIVGTESGAASFLLAAQISSFDRSGLAIPSTSPFVDELTASTGGLSRDDKSTPLSLFGSFAYDYGKRGQITVQSGLQRLRSNAEWLDYGALTGFSQVDLYNYWIRLGYGVDIGEQARLNAFTSFAEGGPGGQHRIRPLQGFSLAPDTSRHLEEDFRSRASLSGLEVLYDIPELKLGFRFGTDLEVDVEQLTSATAVFDEETGGRRPGDAIFVASSRRAKRTFSNVGLFLQAESVPLKWISLIGGLRYDYNSLYGSAVSGRLGSVFRATDWLYLKALYGSSFRAPAPDQLYRGAAYVGDAIGCLDYEPCATNGLEPQNAHTGELVVGARTQNFGAQVTGFLSYVDDFILSFPNNANAFVTTNAGTYLSRGLELEGSFKAGSQLRVEGQASLTYQFTSPSVPQALFDPPESIRAEFREESLFPAVTAAVGVDLAYQPAHLGVYLEGRFVGARRASGNNLALSLGLSNYDGNNLPAYFELDMNISTRDLYLFESGETVVSLRLTDMIGARHAEGGFRGWDIPSLGRAVYLRIIQEY